MRASGLLLSCAIWHVSRVKILSVFPRLLSILAILGFLTALAATLPAAGTLVDAPTAAMADMTSMPDGMPCCPHEKQSIPDCQKNCPFAALCTAQCVLAVPGEVAFLVRRLAQAEPLTLYNEALRDQRSVAPPQRPPRV
jgi:hypothetical protein